MSVLSNGVVRASLWIWFGAVPLIQPVETAAQSGKFTGTGKLIAVLAETTMMPGDKPGHVLALGSRIDANTNSDPIFGTGQAMLVGVSDDVAGNGPHRGYSTITHSSGDKTFTSYEGTTKSTPRSGGPPEVTFEGTWRYTGGTGKFEGITGQGTYKGRLTPTGPAYTYEGRYTLKQ